MFGKSFKLFSIFGFEIKIDISWLILAFLITWSLAKGFFPYYIKGLSTTTYWWMGIIGALGLFLSIIFHELSHSLMARTFGLPIKGITLFIFGGVAQMEDEPPSAHAEFLMAIAGPVSSIVLGVLFYLVRILGKAGAWPVAVVGILGYLAFINWLLAGFNLLPAFPLDGGRVLRSVLWNWKKNIGWATRISSKLGAIFGLLLIFLGIIQFFTGNFMNGIWWFMIGLFLQNAARMSYQQLLTRQALEGEPVKHFMKPNPVTVPPSISIDELVENYIYKYHFKMFPIVSNSRFIGCISTRDVKAIPRTEWKTKKVEEVASSCSPENLISPETDAVKALALIHRTGSSRLMVVENDKLVGILALKDIMKFLSIKLDLDGYDK
jgi:Zn-dependent protease/CBS domain-containing protein